MLIKKNIYIAIYLFQNCWSDFPFSHHCQFCEKSSYHIGVTQSHSLFLDSLLCPVQLLSPVELCHPRDYSTPAFPVHHPTPGTCSNSCPFSQWWHPTILCCPLLLLSSILPSIRVFSNESVLCIRWSKYWSFSFSISPSNKHPGLISFKMDWLDLLSVQGTLKILLQHHSLKGSILQCSAFFLVQLSHPYDYWKNHSFDYTYLCGQRNVSAF